MSFIKVMVHSVWGTKNHQPLMKKEIKEKIISHIKVNAKSKEIFIDEINGYLEHLHCIFGMNADLSISKTMQLIKGESAHWINLEGLLKEKFEWADEYFAVSVSESMLSKVSEYRKKTFKEEYDEFINKYNFRIHG
ncbi:MAG: IS200/IS605 family transposase [Ignavibacteria bacterium]